MSVSAPYGEGLPDRAVGDDPPSDHTLVHYIRAGDDTAAELLYHRYATRLRKIIAHRCSPEFASRFDADDVVQSVFRLFYEGVRSRYYEVPKDGELWGLLFVLAVNKVKDQSAHHRAAKRSVYRTTTVAADNTETGISQDDQTATLLRLVVEEYLNQLPEQERTIVGLRMTGHSVAEIAEKTGRALRTIERILQKSRDRLQELLNSN